MYTTTATPSEFYEKISGLIERAKAAHSKNEPTAFDEIFRTLNDLPREFGFILATELFNLDKGSILSPEAKRWLMRNRQILIDPASLETPDLQEALSMARSRLLASENIDTVFFGHLALQVEWKLRPEFLNLTPNQQSRRVHETIEYLIGAKENHEGDTARVGDDGCWLGTVTNSEFTLAVQNAYKWANRWGTISPTLQALV